MARAKKNTEEFDVDIEHKELNDDGLIKGQLVDYETILRVNRERSEKAKSNGTEKK